MTITVRYSALDGARSSRTFKTAPAARAFAVRYVGERPKFGSAYAVSADGIGKITAEGIALADLFKAPKSRKPTMEWRMAETAPGRWECRLANGMTFDNSANAGAQQAAMRWIAENGFQQVGVAPGCFCVCDSEGFHIGNGYDTRAEAEACVESIRAEGYGGQFQIQDWSKEFAEHWAADQADLSREP